MEAVIKTGGKQYRVREGDVIDVEKVSAKSLTLKPLLVTDNGQPVSGKSPSVKASLVGEAKGDKVVVFKFKAKKGYRRKAGHRQQYSQLKIEKITA